MTRRYSWPLWRSIRTSSCCRAIGKPFCRVSTEANPRRRQNPHPHPTRTWATISWVFNNSREGKPRYSGRAEPPSRRLPSKPIGKPFNTGSRTRLAWPKPTIDWGLALRDQGQPADAQRELEQALALSPNAPAIINNLGRILADQHKQSRAIELFERAIILRPNYAEARFNLAQSLERIDTRRAIEEYETYIALVEGSPREAKRIRAVQERVKRLRGD